MMKRGMCMDYEVVIDEETIKDVLIEVRTNAGMSRKKFAEYFNIPYRTVQDWELGNRQMPAYLLRLIIYKIKMEELIKDDIKGEV